MNGNYADIRAAVERLCGDFPGPYWREHDRARSYPREFVEALSAAGYLGILIPETYGGAGLGIEAACAVLEEIHLGGCNGAACHAQMYTMGTLLRHGSEAQKQMYLPQIAAGALRLQAFGVTEPSSGTDTSRIRTTAVRHGDRYRVSGQKVFISRTEHSDLMLLLVRTTAHQRSATVVPRAFA
jgi:alkylation response protein AidB-like acyl-CoA dehydrogenase